MCPLDPNQSSKPTSRGWVLADDLTGTIAAASLFRQSGLDVEVHVRWDAVDWGHAAMCPVPVNVVNLAMRNASTGTVASRMAQTLEQLTDVKGPRDWVGLRIDSTLRGPIAQTIQLVMEHFPNRIAVLVAAYPETGRTTRDGIHAVAGIPVADTEIGSDPFHPVQSSDIREWIGSRLQVRWKHVPWTTVQSGDGALAAYVAQGVADGVRLFMFDCCAQTDVDAIAAALAGITSDGRCGLIPVDPGPFTAALLKNGVLGTRRPERRHEQACVFAISGSLIPTAVVQMDYLERTGDAYVFRYEGQPVDAVLSAFRSVYDKVPILAIRTDLWDLHPSRTELWTDQITTIIRAVRTAFPTINGYYLSGGDTAEAVLSGLGVKRLEVADPLAPLVGLCKAMDGALAGAWLVTKGGAVGDPAAVHRVTLELVRLVRAQRGDRLV